MCKAFEELMEEERENGKKEGRKEGMEEKLILEMTGCTKKEFAVYNNIRAEKEVLLFWDYGHEDLPGFCDRIYQFFLELL